MNRRTILCLAACAALPYLRGFDLPWISDDYLHLDLALDYGSPAGWGRLGSDALYRTRATSLLLASGAAALFGLDHSLFQAISIALHALNVFLVARLGRFDWIGWRVSVPAATFFGLHEIKQEAVLWHAAVPELLVFCFALLTVDSFICGRYRAAFCFYLAALASKESAVAVVPLLAVWLLFSRVHWSRFTLLLAPYACVSALYAWSIFSASATHLHLNDGTFSLSAPFWIPLTATIGRLFWFWGLLSALVLLRWRDPQSLAARPLLAAAALWLVAALLPYSFLTYMPRIPSRHTYLASLGVAFVCALAWHSLAPRLAPWARVALVAAVVVHNAGYVLFWKHKQYVDRARPTETLVRFALDHPGPFRLLSFPYSRDVAVSTLKLRAGRRPETWAWKSGGSGPSIYIDETGRLAQQP